MVETVKEVGAFEAKNRLSELLREVEAGRSFVITRRGKRVARLAPPGGEKGDLDLSSLREAFENNRLRVEGTVDVIEFVNEGRRR